jgi:hypothetical protein
METGFPPQAGNVTPFRPPMAAPQMQQPEPLPPRAPTWADTWERPADDPKWTDEALLKKFSAWDKTDTAHWADWRIETKLCYDVTAGRQWDKGAEDAAKDASLTIVVINKVDSTVSAICGSEMTNRQEVRYYPRETSTKGPDGQRQDVVVNEILTSAAEWARDECDAADEESESFRDVIICGLGFVETHMSYDVDPDGLAIVERCDPLEFRIGASARRPNAVDAPRIVRDRPFPKDEAEERFGLDGESGQGPSDQKATHDNSPGSAYESGDGETKNADDVWVTEYQWFELERLHKVQNPNTGEIEELTQAEFDKAKQLLGDDLDSATVKIRRYYRAFRCGNKIVEVTALPDEEFTYKIITGKLDRNKGVWYGVVRSMVDPQRLLNKQVSQIQRIIDTNAKGGILYEAGAFEDQEDAESRWAASDSMIETKAGAISGGKIIPKPIAQYPAGLDRLLQIANEAVPGVSGVNNEMLGVIDREQAGVVDVQRKEAAYGVLKSFFNSLRRYRRMHGRHLLKLISKYMTDGRLIRIIGRTGSVQYLQLIRQPDTVRYDVIVDEAPTGPNQKDKVFGFMVAMMPLLRSMNLPPQIMLKLMEFSPLPTSLIAEIQEEVKKIPPQPNPDQEKAKGEAAKAQADLQRLQVETQIEQQRIQMEAQANSTKMQIEASKLQGANQKLEVENQWVKIEMARAAMEQQNSNQEAQLRARETGLREQNDTAKIQADIEKMRVESEIKLAELDIKRQELELSKAELALKGRELEVKRDMETAKLAQSARQSPAPNSADGAPAAAASGGSGSDTAQILAHLAELAALYKAPRRVKRDPQTGRADTLELVMDGADNVSGVNAPA